MSIFNQAELDNDRLSYLLTFPSELDEKRVLAWLSSISGNLHVSLLDRMFGVPSIVFETFADDQGITHRLRVPARDAHYVISHLESLVPGINVTEDKGSFPYKWVHGTELGMRQPSRTLRVASTPDFSASILTSMQSLRDKEAVLIQWVLSPALHEAPPHKESSPATNDWSLLKALINPNAPAGMDEVEDRRRKLETPNMLAIGRIAVAAPHEIRAREIAREVLHAFAEAKVGRNRLTEKVINPEKLSDVINRATTPMLFPGQLNMAETASFISWPIGSPFIAGLPQSRTRHMHVNNSVPTSGGGNTIIGVSTVRGPERDIAIEPLERLKHIHIIGPIGSGKTGLAATIGEQDMKDGHGIVLIETKSDPRGGDLFSNFISRVPRERWDDVIVWDLDDTEYPVGFNVLRQGGSRSAIDDLNNLITTMYPESGVLTTGPLYHGLHALAEYEHGTFIDLPSLLSPNNADEARWREEMVKGLKRKELSRYWQTYLSKEVKAQDKEAQPLQRRLWQFAARPEIRNTLGQSESTFYMEDVVKNGKILLVNLNPARIGPNTASVMGTLIVDALWKTVRTTSHEKPVILYMDEFQNLLTMMPTSASEMLAQSRSFGLGMVLAHQSLGQITNRELQNAVITNARSKIIFQTSRADAKTMADEFGHGLKPEDFLHLQKREAIARIMTGSGVSRPFTMRTKDWSQPTAHVRLIREMSRAKYGRPVEEVEAAIEARRQATKSERTKRPSIGWKTLDEEQSA